MKKIIATVLAVSAVSTAYAGPDTELEVRQPSANLADSFVECTQTHSLSRSVSKEDLFYDESSDDEQAVVKKEINLQQDKTEKSSLGFSGFVSSWISAAKTVVKKLFSLFW